MKQFHRSMKEMYRMLFETIDSIPVTQLEQYIVKTGTTIEVNDGITSSIQNKDFRKVYRNECY